MRMPSPCMRACPGCIGLGGALRDRRSAFTCVPELPSTAVVAAGGFLLVLAGVVIWLRRRNYPARSKREYLARGPRSG